MASLEENLQSVVERIGRAAASAGRDPNTITLVAVSKTVPVESIVAAARLGVANLGENRVEEAQDKIPVVAGMVPSRLTWHMIGHLQHRKVKQAVALFDIVHSVDSVALARRIDQYAAESGKLMPILLEINTSGEPAKNGFPVEPKSAVYDAAAEIIALAHVSIQGLMTMAPIVSRPDDARPYFGALRRLRDELAARFDRSAWNQLSMGMTDDFEAAIAEGATMVRIGRALFGDRPLP